MENSLNMKRLAKNSKRAALISVAGLLIVVSSLVYSALKLYSLQAEIQRQSDALNNLKREHEETTIKLKEAEKKLQKAGAALNLTPDQLSLIRDYAIKSQNFNPDDPNLPVLLEQMAEADEELKKIRNSTADNRHRASIKIRYYEKSGDGSTVKEALKELRDKRGFDVETKTGKQVREPDTPTNAIWLVSPGVSTEDVRLVAYSLIRVGVQIRHIGTSGASHNPRYLQGIPGTMIWIGSEPEYSKDEVWTVERIRNTANFYVP